MQEHTTRHSVGKVFVAFLGGVLVGGITALFLAPQSGRDTQEQVRQSFRRTGRDLRDLQKKTTDTYHGMVEETRQYLGEMQSIVKDALEAGRKEMQDTREKLADEAQEVNHHSSPTHAD